MYLNSLIIESTRRCQLRCSHCLRGEPECLDMSYDVMYSFLRHLKGGDINTVTFSGGEPLLKPRVIEEFVSICTELKIGVDSFYVATNGIPTSQPNRLSRRALLALISMYCYCDSNEMSQVQLSMDQYHDYEIPMQLDNNRLKALAFASEKEVVVEDKYLIKMGRCTFGGRELKYEPDLKETEFYLNCKGRVVFDCDLSYEMQDEHGVSIEAAINILRNVQGAQ